MAISKIRFTLGKSCCCEPQPDLSRSVEYITPRMSIIAIRSLVALAWLAFTSMCSSRASPVSTIEVPISVPSSYKLTSSDSYVCTTVELPSNKPLKLIGVKPRADMQIVHHILLYGCRTPFMRPDGKEQPAWDCGHQSICADGGSNILYGM